MGRNLWRNKPPTWSYFREDRLILDIDWFVGGRESDVTVNRYSLHEWMKKHVSIISCSSVQADLSPERSINLFHCLNELNDCSLVEEIQQYLTSGSVPQKSPSPVQLSTLAFILLTSEEELEMFDLKKYSDSEEGLLRSLPVVKASKTSL